MSHMIDESTGRAAIAYRNDEPWHGLGTRLEAGANLEQWREAAGLNYSVCRAPVMFTDARGVLQGYPTRHVLYRSDTAAPLSVVGREYKVVQPEEIVEFFRDIVEISGFEMETMGALSDGKRVWAMARVAEGAAVLGKDHVRPYLMVATSYDATMSTTAKFVAERVVCHNTITLALGENNAAGMIRISHGKSFDADAIKRQLGVSVLAWNAFMNKANKLANREINESEREALTLSLCAPATEQYDPRESKGFKRVMSLFDKGIGTELTEGPTAWRWLNAVTQYVDWERGLTPSSRINSAWFGEGDNMKKRALKNALELA